MEGETHLAESVAGAPLAASGSDTKQPLSGHIQRDVPYRVTAMLCIVLGVLIYNVVVFVGWYGYVYGPSSVCVVGPLCSMATVPPALQAILFGLGLCVCILCVWLVARPMLRQANQGTPESAGRRFAAFIASLGDVRKVFVLVCGLVLVCVAVTVGTHRGSALAYAMSALTLCACRWGAVASVPQFRPISATGIYAGKLSEPNSPDDAEAELSPAS